MSNVNIQDQNSKMVWEIGWMDFSSGESVSKYIGFLTGFLQPLNKQDIAFEASDKISEITGKISENDINILKENIRDGKIFGVRLLPNAGNLIHYVPNERSQVYSHYILKEQRPEIKEVYRKLKKAAGEAKEYYSQLFDGKEDEESKKLDKYAKQIASWIDLNTQIGDPDAGDIAKAETEMPVLSVLNSLQNGAPRFETLGLKKCIDVLEQKNNPEAQSIYSDYMTLMFCGAIETKIQYDRQKAERDGWNSEKERNYLNELKKSHQAVVEAFDRLWEIKDTSIYDEVLNQGTDHILGRKYAHARNGSDAIGYMKGELQAMEMGYDSRHLFILGQIGLQEQSIKRLEVSLEEGLNNPDYNEKDKLEMNQKKENLMRYKTDLEALKQKVWSKKVNSIEEMEAAGDEVEKFFAEHDKAPYESISVHGLYKQSFEHIKKESKSFVCLDITYEDAEIFWQVRGNDFATVDEVTPYHTLARNIKDDNLSRDELVNNEKKIKELAGRVSEKLAAKEKEYADAIKTANDDVKRAYELANQTIRRLKMQTDSLIGGVHIDVNSGFFDVQNRIITDYILRAFNEKMFKDPQLAFTAKMTADLDLDNYIKAANDIQEQQLSYMKSKGKMPEAERNEAFKKLLDSKKTFIDRTKDLQEKLAGVSEDVKKIFAAGGRSSVEEIIGENCLQKIVRKYEDDIKKAAEASMRAVRKKAANKQKEEIPKTNWQEHVNEMAANTKRRAANWLQKIKSVDFNMLGMGSKEFDNVLHNINEYKDAVDNIKISSNIDVRINQMNRLKRFEGALEESLENYLSRKENQFRTDAKRKDNASKQKREQPRIKAVLEVLKELKDADIERENLTISQIQEEGRAKLLSMLDEEDKKRTAPDITIEEYQKSVFKSLCMIRNLNGSKWYPKEGESLRDFCLEIKMNSDPETYEPDMSNQAVLRSNRVYTAYEIACKEFKNNNVTLTNEDLKDLYVKKTSSIEKYEDKYKKYDLEGKKKEVADKHNELKEKLVSKVIKEEKAPAVIK